MLNFDSFIEIKSSNTRNTVSQKYDLTYSPKRELFTLSEAAISNMGIGFQQKGLTVMYNGLDNQVVFITKPEADSRFFKTKDKSSKKGNSFKNTSLRGLLDDASVNTVGMTLKHAGTRDDIDYYLVVAEEESGLLTELVEEESVEEESPSLVD